MRKRFTNLITLLKLTTITSVLIAIYNQFIIYNASEKKRLARSTNKKIYRSNKGNIFYTLHGEGSPILLIHDLTAGGSGYEWNRIEKELAEKHTVYTIDLPGCGRSEKKKQIYTNDYYVQLLNDFITNVIRRRTDIIASGYSGSIALAINKNNKKHIKKIILINPCNLKKYTKKPSNKDIIFYYVLLTPIFGTLIYHMLVSCENIDNLFVENYYYNPFHLDTDMEDAYYEASHRNQSLSKYIYASLIRNYTGCNVGSILRYSSDAENIAIYYGEAEQNYQETIHQYQDIRPEINVSIIKHAKHFPHVEQPQTFLIEAEQFLTGKNKIYNIFN